MGNVYKDEAGHFTDKENNGGPCRHKRISGGKYEYSEDGGKSWNAFEKREDYDTYETDEDERFDETNDDDFGFDEDNGPSEEDEREYVEKCLGDIETATDKEAFEYISSNIDELTEAGLISEETSDMLYAKLDEKIDESNKEMTEEQEDEDAEESVAAEEIKEEEQETYSDDDLGYRKNDKGGFDILVKETEDRDEKLLKSVNSRDEARQYIRSLLGKNKNVSDYKEFSSDSEARKYFDEHAHELPDGSALYGNKIYLGEDKNKGNPYVPEKLPDEGLSQEELDKKLGKEEKKPYNREEKVKEYLKEQDFDDDYINKTLENMKKNMNIGQFWDRFFKDKEEK